MDQALLLFAKAPRPGSVKTRLTPVLTPEEAAQLYKAFLQDVIQRVQVLEFEVRVYLAPPIPEGRQDEVLGDTPIRRQKGPSLGARMEQAFQETLEEGFEDVLLMGTDHPTLPISFLRQGARALQQERSVAIGPTEDGGFYLLGMNAFYPELFDDMSYSHSQVFSDTLARAGQTNAQITVLPQWYDVDTPPDIERLISDLQKAKVNAPHTKRKLVQLSLWNLDS